METLVPECRRHGQYLCGGGPRRESLDSGAAASAAGQLVQQVDEEVDSFQERGIFVCSGSQELGVNLLVGFEDYVFIKVTTGLKKNREQEMKERVTPTRSCKRDPRTKD